MVGLDPVSIQVHEELGPVPHALRVVVERRTVAHEELRVRVRRGVVERQQPLQDAGYVQL